MSLWILIDYVLFLPFLYQVLSLLILLVLK